MVYELDCNILSINFFCPNNVSPESWPILASEVTKYVYI